MKNTLFVLLGDFKVFWISRRIFTNLVFKLHKIVFVIRLHTWEKRRSSRSLVDLLWNTAFDLISAITITVLLQVVDPFAAPLIGKLGLTIPVGSAYVTLLAAGIGVGGILIGLYYAAISSIGSAVYTKAPNEIRELLAQERLGSAYMRYLAGFTYTGVCLLVFNTMGLNPIVTALPLYLIGAGLAIIGFVVMGKRAFHLFDPTILSGFLFERVQRCTKQMQAGSFKWYDHQFQNHAYQVASSRIKTLLTISDISSKEVQLNGTSYANLCEDLLSFLYRYEKTKKKIPTDSLWYRKQSVHRDWYRSDETETSVAYETATGLQPQRLSNLRWIENELWPIVLKCLETNISLKRFTIVSELLLYVDAYIQRLAEEHQTDFAFEIMRDVHSLCYKSMVEIEQESNAKNTLECMSICELVGSLPITFMVNYINHLESYGLEKLRHRIRRINWNKKQSVYGKGFAVHVLPQLEWLQPRLMFEIRVERRLITSHWYIEELLIMKEAENLSETMTCLFEEQCRLYKDYIDVAEKAKCNWTVALIITKELEYWRKLNYHLDTLVQFWTEIESSRRLDGLTWPAIDLEKLKDLKRRREDDLLFTMSGQNVLLSLRSRPKDYPDFAGMFLHTVGEALLLSLCKNDSDLVENLFSNYLKGSLLQYERLRSEITVVDWKLENELKTSFAPILDMMDVSGYAFLLSEYHNEPRIKNAVVQAWDGILNENAKIILRLTSTVINVNNTGFPIDQRFTNRVKWQQLVTQHLTGIERKSSTSDSVHDSIRAYYDIDHSSPLVRVCARGLPMFLPDGTDIFIAMYIRHRKDAEGFDFRRPGYSDVADQIDREENVESNGD